MYASGFDEGDVLLQQQQYYSGMNMPRSTEGRMYREVEGKRYEIEEDNTRGEEHSPLINSLTSHLLRIGFSLQASSLIFALIFYVAFGGSGIFVFDLYAAPENVSISRGFHFVVTVLTAFYLMGIFYICMFQVFAADSSKWCRGFRTGSKILSAAVTLDFVSTSLRLVQYLYAFYFMSMKWWSKYQQTKCDWLLFNAGNLLNGFALSMYGFALFYMEAYHDEGIGEEYAWLHLFLYNTAAFFEILMIFTGYGAFFTLFLLSATISGCIWSYSYEPLLYELNPELHSRDVNMDIEISPKQEDAEKQQELQCTYTSKKFLNDGDCDKTTETINGYT